ncbi:TraR/DksA family transcriptional regulator [Microbacterium sp.]|jgi:DnaK suppressor protein|uniref:TraR/DksA family transcriptional regulator n=1 Tax=Microbacterium sp. TaxID=51671 RepID=UPI0037C576C9
MTAGAEIPGPSAGDAPDYAGFIRARRDEIQTRLALVEAQLIGIRGAREEWTDDEHDPEGSTLITEWSRAEGLRGEYLAELDDLEHARERLDAGEYGRCTRCGERIVEGRLRLRPAATKCVPCLGASR